jgi:hypothetical protein
MSAELITNGLIGLLMLGLMWQQNRILRMQNEILAHEAGIVSNPARPTYRKYWPMLVMGVLMLLTWGAVAADHYDRLYHPKVVERIVAARPYKFEFKPDAALEVVSHRVFADDTVLLDGHDYEDCTFTNVSFKYNGTTRIGFNGNQVNGHFLISTDNEAILGSFIILKGLGVNPATIPIVAGPEMKPVPDVTPFKRR